MKNVGKLRKLFVCFYFLLLYAVTGVMSVKCYCMMVYPFQVFNGKDLTEEMTKMQSVLSDDKNDWEHRVAAVSIKK